MNLTKEIRKDLAAKLTAKAIEKHAPAMAKKVKALNTKFTEVHSRHLASLIPEVPESSWNKMIQLGMTTSTAGGGFWVWCSDRDENGRLNNSNQYLGALTSGYKAKAEDFKRVKSMMSDKWSKVLGCFDVRTTFDGKVCIYSFDPEFDRVMPAFADYHRINLCDLEPENIKGVDQLEQARIRALAPLVKQVDELSAEFMLILTQALDYHEKVSDLLDACRTEKQLADLFPEAAAMLPQRVKKSQPVVPVELAKSVRRMLAEGVPA